MWLCGLANSIASDFSKRLKEVPAGNACVCQDSNCYVGDYEQSWSLGRSRLEVGLATSVEAPYAPDGTAVATLLITLDGPAQTETADAGISE